jgi:hypothetical protein
VVDGAVVKIPLLKRPALVAEAVANGNPVEHRDLREHRHRFCQDRGGGARMDAVAFKAVVDHRGSRGGEVDRRSVGAVTKPRADPDTRHIEVIMQGPRRARLGKVRRQKERKNERARAVSREYVLARQRKTQKYGRMCPPLK